MRDGDPVQVHRIQERWKHCGGFVGVVRWYRTITGVGETGGGWYWWATCGEGRTRLYKHERLTYKIIGDFLLREKKILQIRSCLKEADFLPCRF